MPLIEQIAEYWNRAKCEAWHGTAEVGSKEWSDQITEQRYFVQPHIPKFADFPRWKGKRVLEIGCGIGTDTLEFVKAGAYVDAIDQSKESINIASRRMLVPHFVCADAEKYRYPQWEFDLIYSFGVLHHTPHPKAILRNLAYYSLKPDGELRIMLYARWSWKKLMGHQPEAQAGCPLVRWYTVREARRMVESCGFKVTSIRKTHIFPWRIPDYTQHKYVKAFPWNIIPHQWLEPWLGHHILLKAVKA
jgi:SAM-dependent methyltransferase